MAAGLRVYALHGYLAPVFCGGVVILTGVRCDVCDCFIGFAEPDDHIGGIQLPLPPMPHCGCGPSIPVAAFGSSRLLNAALVEARGDGLTITLGAQDTAALVAITEAWNAGRRKERLSDLTPAEALSKALRSARNFFDV